ncbi:hypothetical protein TM4_73 [Mycobacterium phage TM4]|uniref:Uncharacterized protein n=1 Tax=Mycobacterium phage TM4 TaxID=88870 RepID=Q9ZX07_BPMT4|nr:hypothetical protein TM4_gp73 [Mycobacterium phage TM4]AAD17638.1 hypothetical protein TM4_73 [Mycobacterium phage TM4]
MRHYRIELLIKSDLTEEQVAERVEGRPGPVFGGQVVDAAVYEVTHFEARRSEVVA